VNLVKKGNLKDAKYLILDEPSSLNLKQMYQHAKNKFQKSKFNS
jgi:hypothetical protein